MPLKSTSSIRLRKWSLFAFFALIAIAAPVCAAGTEGEPVAWAWFLFFGLQAILVLAQPQVFLPL